MIRSLTLFLSVFLCAILVTGCGSKKRIADPIDPRAKRSAALKKISESRQPPPPPGKTDTTSQPVIVETEIIPRDQPSLDQGRGNSLMSTLTFINDRIFAYDKKIAAWQEIAQQSTYLNLPPDQTDKLADCLKTLSEIKTGYTIFHDQLIQKEARLAGKLISSQTFLDLQKRDISFLDGHCGQIPTAIEHQQSQESTSRPDAMQDVSEKINALMKERSYPEIIELYQQLPRGEGQQPEFITTYQFGQALLRSRKEKQALAVFQDLLRDTRIKDFTNREFKLMRTIGDLELALENYPEARNQYDKIITTHEGLAQNTEWARNQLSMVSKGGTNVKERKAYAGLLKSYLGYDANRDGFKVADLADRFLQEFPYSQVASGVEKLAKESRIQAKQWFSSFLTEIDDLVNEKKFQQALIKLESLPQSILPVEQQEMLKTRVDEVTTAEAIESETQIFLKEQNLQDNWNTAMVHLEARRYDEAIEAFQKLKGTSLDDKAQLRISEAASQAAKDDRRRAAELFVRANRTHDLESRKKLLLGSRRLLKDILVKYPQSDLLPKVTKNLRRIEEEILQIDPALLQEQATVGTQENSLKGALKN